MAKNNAEKGAHDKYMCYVNRELSWLRFNERVLEEAEDGSAPLLERLNFINIFQSNLDEFFMVRVGGLKDAAMVADGSSDVRTGMTAKEQLAAILPEVTRLQKRRDAAFAELMRLVERQGVKLSTFDELSKNEQDFARIKFKEDIKPLLFPAIVGKRQPFPFMKSGEVYGFALLETRSGKRRIAIVPSLSPMFPQTVVVAGMSAKNRIAVIGVDELILHFFADIFPEYKVLESSLIRIVRNADIDEEQVYDEEIDYRAHMAEVIKRRKKLAPVKLELSRELSPAAVAELCSSLKLEKKWVFKLDTPLSPEHIKRVMDILGDKPKLSYPRRIPQRSPLLTSGDIIPQILDHDLLLHYPYESINPFLDLLRQAARDDEVISIQMTLYRMAKNSKVIEALEEAAENGKEVDVLVELKARFDEENNINWSKRLEQAGCRVIYGIDGLKVHSKLCLITRRSGDDIQYITQVGTGNYNETTARLYTDLSIMTADRDIGSEASRVFRSLLMGETVKETEQLMVAPNCLQSKILDRIDAEIEKARAGKPAYLGFKLNSMTDIKIMRRLIKASQAGVKIEMAIRGICCLRPGIEGYTDNIRIVSVVGRLLEHSRIYIFGREDPEVFIGSADLMTRNTEKRVEIAAPILDPELRRRTADIFDIVMNDTYQAREMLPDGSYRRLRTDDSQPAVQER
ncbi:MAG: polyphosphate kinase 1, partial [Ruminococcus sp.]|nr:polyphosphate kinase 1 [Ruminococcus sp.]